MRILVAEDDAGLRSVLERGLKEAGYVVDGAADGDKAKAFLQVYDYGVCIVDWRMPGTSGLELIQWARRLEIHTPFLMLTARDAPPDRIEALDEGADDYLIKPFDYGELLARIRALLRRPSGERTPIFRCGSLSVNPATRQALVDGVSADLTPREFSIIELLIRRSPAVVRRQSIALQAWPEEADAVGSNTIDVHIARLRAKIARSDAKIETLRGAGYRLVAGVTVKRSNTSAERLRVNVRRVSLSATAIAFVVYVAASFFADLLIVDHLHRNSDARLQSRIAEISPIIALNGPKGPIGSYTAQNTGDLDDAPVVLWWLPKHSAKAINLETHEPSFPSNEFAITGPSNTTVAGRPFRLDVASLPAGRIVAGTSSVATRSALNDLLLIEAILAPIALLTLYGAAEIIGRRAAGPVERSRQRQLEFTADASHELRTPLSVIEAEVGLALSMDRNTLAYKQALERIAGESTRLRHIVEDLLWLARLDAFPKAPPEEVVDVASVVHVCVRRFAAVASQRGISIASDVDETIPPLILCPAEWIDRLVSVLLDNACRYAGENGEIEVSVAAVEGHVVLNVDDSGPGIPEADRERIFLRFHRASSTPGGAGLGLSIGNAVVRATGGKWKISHAPTGGARFSISWPLAE